MSWIVTTSGHWLLFALLVLVLPPLMIGILRKCKAIMQNRIGASVLQPFFDLKKFWNKEEMVSETASWIFRSTAAINCAVVLLLAVLIPSYHLKPEVSHADLVLVLYLLALNQIFYSFGCSRYWLGFRWFWG